MPGNIVIYYVGKLINNTITDFGDIEYYLRKFEDYYLFWVNFSTILIFQ